MKINLNGSVYVTSRTSRTSRVNNDNLHKLNKSVTQRHENCVLITTKPRNEAKPTEFLNWQKCAGEKGKCEKHGEKRKAHLFFCFTVLSFVLNSKPTGYRSTSTTLLSDSVKEEN